MGHSMYGQSSELFSTTDYAGGPAGIPGQRPDGRGARAANPAGSTWVPRRGRDPSSTAARTNRPGDGADTRKPDLPLRALSDDRHMWERRRRHPRATIATASSPSQGQPLLAGQATPPAAKRAITWVALALITVGSVGNLGSTPPLAVLGLASAGLYILPAILFLLPVSLVAAELASAWPGGVYNWVEQGLSAPAGLLAVWCEFAQTIFFYPALLAYIADTLAYVIDPRLAGNGVYTAVIIIVLFWGGVLVTSRGSILVAKLSSSGTVIGTLIPGALIVGLGVAYLLQGHRSAAPMTIHHVLPAWQGVASIVLVVNSFFTYAGVEVNAVHVDELKNPGREYPRSIFVALGLCLTVFIFPTLAIAWVVPSGQLSFTAGVMQAFNRLLTNFGAGWGVPVVAIALAAGALAGMLAWLDGPSEGLLRIGREQGFLPPFFQQVNGQGIEIRILTAQGAVITAIALLYAFIPSVTHAYWIFAVMATQVYMIMYVLMFIAAIRLRRSQPDRPRGYRAPALRLLCVVGIMSSVAALVIGFVPPSQFGHSNALLYAVLILAGILAVGVIPPLLMDRFRRTHRKVTGDSGDPAAHPH
jgi:glutamate:GABA antiporter